MTFFLVLLWTVYACRFVWRSVWRFAGSSALQVALFMVRSVGGRPGWTASTLGAATMVSGRPGRQETATFAALVYDADWWSIARVVLERGGAITFTTFEDAAWARVSGQQFHAPLHTAPWKS